MLDLHKSEATSSAAAGLGLVVAILGAVVGAGALSNNLVVLLLGSGAALVAAVATRLFIRR